MLHASFIIIYVYKGANREEPSKLRVLRMLFLERLINYFR
jgi:hypothetical protein